MDVYRKIMSWSEMEGNPTEIENILFPILNIQRFMGQQVLDKDWTPSKHVYKLILATTLMCYGIVCCIKFIFSEGVGIDERSEGFAFFLIAIQAVVKFVITIYGGHNLRKLFDFNQKVSWPLIHGNGGLESVQIKKRIREIIAIKIVFIFMLSFSIFVYELTTLLTYIDGNRVNLFKCADTLLPNTSPFFEIGWALHSLFGFQIAFTQMCFDVVFPFNMIMGCLFVDVMIKKLQDVESEKLPMDRAKALKCICEYHVKFISFLGNLHDMYRVPAISQMLYTLGCITALLLGMESSNSSSLVTVMIPALSQLTVYCWYGQEIKSQGEDLMSRLMMFDWVDLDASTRKSFILITMFMNKELRPGALGSMDLSLNTMKWVMQVSYQNFTVLRRFKQ